MSNLTNDAIDAGRTRAKKILELRRAAHVRRAAALQNNHKVTSLRISTTAFGATESVEEFSTAGFLAAIGDSWFDYPFHDVLKDLEDDYGYNVESTAHKGDPIEKMAYHGGQIDGFARKLEKIKERGAIPKAVLLSGGGDDVAGSEFGMLLNNALSPIGGWDDEILDGVLSIRISTAYTALLSSITEACREYFNQTLPILIHGYDYPVPDGRGFLGGWPFPGPWLDPGFQEKNFAKDPTSFLENRIAMMQVLMDKFNAMLKQLNTHTDLAHIHYIDLRGTLSNKLTDYKDWWANELHPSEKGFEAVTKKFAAVLNSLD